MAFNELTQCYVKRVVYDFDTRRGILMMEEDSCTDMNGAIKLFQAIDPNVKAIDTFAGTRPDTSYRRHSAKFGGWKAYFGCDI